MVGIFYFVIPSGDRREAFTPVLWIVVVALAIVAFARSPIGRRVLGGRLTGAGFDQEDRLADGTTILPLLVVLLIAPLLLGYFLIVLWPEGAMLTASCVAPAPRSLYVDPCRLDQKLFLLGHWRPSVDQRMLAIVAIAGALGAYVHAATAFGAYVGNREFKRSWALWYLARMPIGAILALITYFVFRGFGVLSGPGPGIGQVVNLLSEPATGQPQPLPGGTVVLNPFAHAAVAALAGMFSKQAADKLAEVFDTLFRSAVRRADQLGANVAPWIEKLDPEQHAPQNADLAIDIHGARFGPQIRVKLDGTALANDKVTRKSDTLLTATLPAAAINTAGKDLKLVVWDPNAGDSNEKLFKVRP